MKHYTAYEIAKNRLLLKQNGKPYTSVSYIFSIIKKWGHTSSTNKHKAQKSYSVPQSDIDKHNQKMKSIKTILSS